MINGNENATEIQNRSQRYDIDTITKIRHRYDHKDTA